MATSSLTHALFRTMFILVPKVFFLKLCTYFYFLTLSPCAKKIRSVGCIFVFFIFVEAFALSDIKISSIVIVRKIAGTRGALGPLTNGRTEPFANGSRVSGSGTLWIGHGGV